MAIISEGGLYAVIQQSRKPLARRFDRWVRHTVLPSIRRTGCYIGDVAATALIQVAALSRAVTETCLRCETPDGVGQIWPTLSRDAAESIWGKIRKGEQPGRDCIQALLPEGSYTHHQIDLALHVLRDGGRLGDAKPIFDARCARLFRLDYHLATFRKFATGDVV